MPIVSLIARPGHLDPALVENLRNAWGGGTASWLSPDEAAEFPCAELPAHAADIASEIRETGTDLAVLPDGNRKKQLLIADMDSTMIEQECIDELADVAGIGDAVKDITARAMNGELDFEAALIERVGLLKGLDEAVIDEVYANRITLAKGGPVLLATMRKAGAVAALVSGGFTQFTDKVASTLGFHHHRANRLLTAAGMLTGEVGRPILGRDAKIAALNEYSAPFGGPQSAVAVGDGANDLGMLEAAGLGVALHAKPSVAAAAPHRIDHGDLTALLFLQGYARSEFAE